MVAVRRVFLLDISVPMRFVVLPRLNDEVVENENALDAHDRNNIGAAILTSFAMVTWNLGRC